MRSFFITIALFCFGGMLGIHAESDVLGFRFSSVSQLMGDRFAIVNEQDGKALFGSTEQNLNYDVYNKAFVNTNTGYMFKLEESSVSGSYLLRLVQPDGSDYSIWGSPGYLNTQPADKDCCFILGLKEQNGQDIENGAVWTIQYEEGKGFSLKNVGTGKYLKDASPAKYDEPTYFSFCSLSPAGERTIDFSGNNTSSNYITYNTAFSISVGDTVNVKMARYCYFSSTITGTGRMNLYAGGERSYLGTSKGAAWPNWSGYTGDIHIYPFKANATNAGFWGVVLAHGGKSFSPENIEDAIKSGKVNSSMANNHVTLHNGATICCEANTAGAGFRIGELQTEEGSTLQGYMKNQRAAYYLLGCLNTDATLAGLIRPSDYRDDTPLGIIKEGTGTLRITGNQNYLNGALRVLNGRVLVNNNVSEAATKNYRGALGAKNSDTEAIAYVFSNGVLGGTGNIAGHVDNYGTIEPGNDGVGTLTLRNYAASRSTHLFVHPSSVLRFKISSKENHDLLDINGNVKYFNTCEDFSTSEKMPEIQLVLDEQFTASVGDEFVLLIAKSMVSAAGAWHFNLRQPGRYTWELEEVVNDGTCMLKARVVSLKDADDSDDPDNPDNPDVSTMGPYYDDGIDDAKDTHTLRYYAQKCGKLIGAAFCTYKGLDSDREEGGRQFNLMVAENEMKMDALQPNRGEYNWWAADNLVSLANNNNMKVRGHCLVWHMQQPQWLSSDGKKNDKNWSRCEALAIMKDHITTVMNHFKGSIKEWDVVNECLDDDQSIIRSNPEGYTLRQTVWQRAIGDDYIDSAFVYARRVDPNILLYLNDYDVEHQGKAKSVAFANLVKHLQNRNIPIDGVGLQCHFSVDEVDSAKFDATFKRFAEMNLKCVITELDMGVKNTTSADFEEQARLYRVVTDIMLHNDNCPYMVIWGLKDNDSWRSASSPLLYDSGMTRKPAWRAVRSAFRHQNIMTSIDTPMRHKPVNDCSEAIFTLDGRRVMSTLQSPNIYIIGGKKVMVR